MTPATNALSTEEALKLKNAMEELPEDYQQVLRLDSWEQIGFEEIGEQMSRTPDAVRKLWTRAVLKLQDVMKRRENDR